MRLTGGKKRGKWEPVDEYPKNEWYRQCSICKSVKESVALTPFCARCGADMRTEDKQCSQTTK